MDGSPAARDLQFDHPFLFTRQACPFPSSRSAPASPQATYPSLPRLPAPLVPPPSAPLLLEPAHTLYPVQGLDRSRHSNGELRYFNQVAEPLFRIFRAEYQRAFEDLHPRHRLDQLFDALFDYVRAEFREYEIHKSRLTLNWHQQQQLRRDLRNGHKPDLVFKFFIGYWNFLYNKIKLFHDCQRSHEASIKSLIKFNRQLEREVKLLRDSYRSARDRADSTHRQLTELDGSIKAVQDKGKQDAEQTRVTQLQLERSISDCEGFQSRITALEEELGISRVDCEHKQDRIVHLEQRLADLQLVGLTPSDTQHLQSFSQQESQLRVSDLERQLIRSRSLNRKLLDDVELADYSDLQKRVAEQESTIAGLIDRTTQDAQLIDQLREQLLSAGASNVPLASQEALLATVRAEARVLGQQLAEARGRERVLTRLVIPQEDVLDEDTFEEGQVVAYDSEPDSASAASHAPNLRFSSPPATSPPAFVATPSAPPPFAPSPASPRSPNLSPAQSVEPDQLTEQNLSLQADPGLISGPALPSRSRSAFATDPVFGPFPGVSGTGALGAGAGTAVLRRSTPTASTLSGSLSGSTASQSTSGSSGSKGTITLDILERRQQARRERALAANRKA
ncbi:hypothetical protein A4X13_0g3536 [Tilletia indica]|uniref:Uncharacterized protein n=1 Tax=Tilletia indica TaxID=43049 RepID=A0A177T9A5_9BASI|nr:hypothetical protein A4X13_0g3536 [Tilletia indica]